MKPIAGASSLQHVVHELREEPHGDVLEGEGRAVEELEDEKVVADLHERADGGMAECAVGRLGHAGQIGLGDLAVCEGAEDRFRHVGVAQPG